MGKEIERFKQRGVYTAIGLALCVGAAIPLSAAAAEETLMEPMNKKDVAIIQALSAKEQEGLNQKLQQAMTLYYAKSYHLALPLFQEITMWAPTKDLLYWMGNSALRGGKPKIAIDAFTAMLEQAPELTGIRIDLAMAYLLSGDREQTSAQLEIVKNSTPNEKQSQRIALLEGKMDLAEKRLFVSMRGSAGLKYDDNMNASSGNQTTPVANGVIDGTSYSSWVRSLDASVDLAYDFAERGGTIWRNRLTHHVDDYTAKDSNGSSPDFTQTDFRTALEHYDEEWRLKLPVGIIKRDYQHQKLSDLNYIALEAERPLRDDLDLLASYRYEDESFVTDKNRQDSHGDRITVGPRIKRDFMGKSHVVTLMADYADRDAKADSLSYQERGANLSLSTTLDERTSSYLQLGVHWKDYKAADATVNATQKRSDHRYNLVAALNRKYGKEYFASASYSYTNADSNYAPYDYDKSVIGITVGRQFNP